ncbi:hypothetical protein [Solimonas marina]|uniref:Uncharacterized protein n=1 Tax=Solimonas marina TaxID=2714601 RepID=A0A969W5Z9_9GAMM|nr:hypothetical protein [Solimonas marina]NKF21057.1 hypothetical protein [Solimonas marina]
MPLISIALALAVLICTAIRWLYLRKIAIAVGLPAVWLPHIGLLLVQAICSSSIDAVQHTRDGNGLWVLCFAFIEASVFMVHVRRRGPRPGA